MATVSSWPTCEVGPICAQPWLGPPQGMLQLPKVLSL